jgi:hypothetical protein
MNSIEERPRPSLWIRRKNNKRGSANKLANWTSTSGSTVLLDNVFRPATATINPIVTSDSTLANNTPVLIPIKSENYTLENYTLENYMPLPTPNARTLENNVLVPALSKTSTHTLEDNMMVPVPRKTSTHALELEDDALVTATTITSPAVIFNSPFRLLDLPRELRDDIYTYLTPDETFWIGRPPVVGEEKNAVVESSSMHKSAALIKSKHTLIFACRATRDEFRSALWRAYVEDADRQAAPESTTSIPSPSSTCLMAVRRSSCQSCCQRGEDSAYTCTFLEISGGIADWSSLIRVASSKHSSCAGCRSVTSMASSRITRSPGARGMTWRWSTLLFARATSTQARRTGTNSRPCLTLCVWCLTFAGSSVGSL